MVPKIRKKTTRVVSVGVLVLGDEGGIDGNAWFAASDGP
jgi:hypothetical protein